MAWNFQSEHSETAPPQGLGNSKMGQDIQCLRVELWIPIFLPFSLSTLQLTHLICKINGCLPFTQTFQNFY